MLRTTRLLTSRQSHRRSLPLSLYLSFAHVSTESGAVEELARKPRNRSAHRHTHHARSPPHPLSPPPFSPFYLAYAIALRLPRPSHSTCWFRVFATPSSFYFCFTKQLIPSLFSRKDPAITVPLSTRFAQANEPKRRTTAARRLHLSLSLSLFLAFSSVSLSVSLSLSAPPLALPPSHFLAYFLFSLAPKDN